MTKKDKFNRNRFTRFFCENAQNTSAMVTDSHAELVIRLVVASTVYES